MGMKETQKQVPVPDCHYSLLWDSIIQLQEVIWTWKHPCLPSIWYCTAGNGFNVCVPLFAAVDDCVPDPRAGGYEGYARRDERGSSQPWKFLLRVMPRATVRGRKGGTVHTWKQTSATSFCFVTTL